MSADSLRYMGIGRERGEHKQRKGTTWGLEYYTKDQLGGVCSGGGGVPKGRHMFCRWPEYTGVKSASH
jgi:hypothetical protein